VELVFDAQLQGQGVLPAFRGTTLRGAFGFSLKHVVCHVSHHQCDKCILRTRCAYPVIFEGMPPDERTFMRRYPYVPQPFVLDVESAAPTRVEPGQPLSFGLRLFGPAADLFPFAVYAVLRMGEAGLGRDRIPFKLRAVSDGQRTIYEHGDHGIRPPQVRRLAIDPTSAPAMRIRLRLATPLRMRVDGRLAMDLAARDIVRALLRRYRILTHFYGESESACDSASLLEQAEATTVSERHLVWQEIPRFSSRQFEHMSLGGLVGHLVLDLPPGQLGSWLRLAESIHLGKATSFGLGRVVYEELPR